MTDHRDRAVERPGRRRRRALPAGVAALALAAGLTACSGGDSPGDPDSSASASAGATQAAPMPPKARIAKVTGRLGQGKRKAVTARVAQTVDAWFEAAYVGGTYPRRAADFGEMFPGFSPGARKQARADRALLSNVEIADRVESVRPVQKSIGLDVLAVDGRAAGVTARVRLVFTTEGEVAGRTVVTGQLNMVPVKGAWQVFAYDVREQRRPAGKASPAPSSTTTESTEEGRG